MREHEISLTVDGEAVTVGVTPRTLLVHTLRDAIGCTAPKIGCERGKCGACTVHLDGDAVKSCLILAVQADGAEIRTAAGLAADELDPVQAAFRETHGVQCGYCSPGMVMTAHALLADDPDPSAERIRRALKGNICRCTGYQNIVTAIDLAAEQFPRDGDTVGEPGVD